MKNSEKKHLDWERWCTIGGVIWGSWGYGANPGVTIILRDTLMWSLRGDGKGKRSG